MQSYKILKVEQNNEQARGYSGIYLRKGKTFRGIRIKRKKGNHFDITLDSVILTIIVL